MAEYVGTVFHDHSVDIDDNSIAFEGGFYAAFRHGSSQLELVGESFMHALEAGKLCLGFKIHAEDIRRAATDLKTAINDYHADNKGSLVVLRPSTTMEEEVGPISQVWGRTVLWRRGDKSQHDMPRKAFKFAEILPPKA